MPHQQRLLSAELPIDTDRESRCECSTRRYAIVRIDGCLADSTWTYAPAPYFHGTDSFTYKVNDGAVDSRMATVTLTVEHVNHAPTATESLVTGTEDKPLALRWSDFTVADVDNDALAIVIGKGGAQTLQICCKVSMRRWPTPTVLNACA